MVCWWFIQNLNSLRLATDLIIVSPNILVAMVTVTGKQNHRMCHMSLGGRC